MFPRIESMQVGSPSPTSEHSPAEPSDAPPPKNSWIRAIARPAIGIEIDDIEESTRQDEQRVQIACLALAAG
jgi:hypothetical protein